MFARYVSAWMAIVLLLLAQTDNTHAQDFGNPPGLNWYEQFEGRRPILGMDSDSAGNLYTLGALEETTDLFGRTFRKGTFISKQDPMGKVIWVKTFVDIQFEKLAMGDMVHVDKKNNSVIFCGVISDTLRIQDHSVHYPSGVECLVVVRYDLDGKFQESSQIELNMFDLEGFTTDPSGNIILTGIYLGTIKIGDRILISRGKRDALVAKYSARGEFKWAIGVGGDNIEYVGLAASDSEGNVYLTGEFISEQIHIGNVIHDMSEGDGNIFFAKLDPDGNLEWAKNLASTRHTGRDWLCWPTGIATTSDGSIYVKGSMADSTWFGEHSFSSTYKGFHKFLLKSDSDGNLAWIQTLMQRQTGYSYWFDYCQLELDSIGNAYMGTQVKDTLEFENGFQYVPSGQDLAICKYSSDGDLRWVKSLTGTDTTSLWIHGIEAFGENNVYIGFESNGQLHIDSTSISADRTSGCLAMLGEYDPPQTGLADFKDAHLRIYPNPACDVIEIDGIENKCELEIIHMNGQIVLAQHLNSSRVQVDISGLPEGSYAVRLHAAMTTSQKILIISR